MQTQKDEPNQDEPDKHKHVQVVVRNEDDGDEYRLNAKAEDAVQSVIDELYAKKLRREPRPTDRLRGEDGTSILEFATMTFEQYREAGKSLVWLFSGPTGGA